MQFYINDASRLATEALQAKKKITFWPNIAVRGYFFIHSLKTFQTHSKQKNNELSTCVWESEFVAAFGGRQWNAPIF